MPTGHLVWVFLFYKKYVCRPFNLFSDLLSFIYYLNTIAFLTLLNDTISMINFDAMQNDRCSSVMNHRCRLRNKSAIQISNWMAGFEGGAMYRSKNHYVTKNI